MRKAKDKGDYSIVELLDELMLGLDVDRVPRLICPLDFREHRVSMTICATKCMKPCANFTEFRFIMDGCKALECTIEAPCKECLEKIDEMKIVIMGLKAVYSKRSSRKYVARRCRKYVELFNTISNHSTERNVEAMRLRKAFEEVFGDDEDGE